MLVKYLNQILMIGLVEQGLVISFSDRSPVTTQVSKAFD